ncbi:hypothetical protein JNO63_06965 [Anaerococcus sp. mt242]|uniref:hypothetical protein n=1 Tax=Anaerococcus sp. mt242 TaxID=2661917 RepID=UPI0019312274|nr:hypothetical protein [Anaerococcus sp. mt242]MBM0046830.1 hypothetical protein [Anaerococcus sp. mt242]
MQMLKVALWQYIEKPTKTSDYVRTVFSWIIVIVFIGLFNVFFDKLNLNTYITIFLRILSIIVLPYVFPALHISTLEKRSLSGILFRFNSIIGTIIAPIYVYKYISKTK